MKINRNSLVNALQKVKPGLSNDDWVEQTNTFVFEKDKIRTYNELISVVFPFTTDLVGAVKAKEFYDIIAKYPDEEIEITQDEFKFIVKGKGRKSSVNTEQQISLPVVSVDGSWKELPGNFKEALSFCLFNASKDMSIPYQNCLNVDEDRIISYDSYRGTIYKLDKEIENQFLIPAKVVKELIKYNPTHYIASNSFIHFKNTEGITFSSRKRMDKFKDLSEFFTVENIVSLTVPKEIEKILDRVAVLAGKDEEGDKLITLVLDNNKLIFEGKGVIGKHTEEIDIEYTGEKLKIMTSPVFLKEIISHSNTIGIGNRLVFETDKFKHVCLRSL